MDLETLDWKFLSAMQRLGTPLLRVTLGIVFIWFGALKAAGVSPVDKMVASIYPIFSEPALILALGIFEVVIGIGLIFKLNFRFMVTMLWLEMAGIFLSLFLRPDIFFQGSNPFLLTFEGEFVIKNIVLIAASIVVAGFEAGPLGLNIQTEVEVPPADGQTNT